MTCGRRTSPAPATDRRARRWVGPVLGGEVVANAPAQGRHLDEHPGRHPRAARRHSPAGRAAHVHRTTGGSGRARPGGAGGGPARGARAGGRARAPPARRRPGRLGVRVDQPAHDARAGPTPVNDPADRAALDRRAHRCLVPGPRRRPTAHPEPPRSDRPPRPAHAGGDADAPRDGCRTGAVGHHRRRLARPSPAGRPR